ncbi:hypothetical protein C1Y63_05600 [Corynebacterium sp. 13CS0277]|uniref:hypothetical protein n=1 Tax=Corynebacterium sp. 13CS0277 TaxID=2071994 RepID=UPI000D041216|nr:hypothetical protein [Corynebacterium sp. 13CS0277]PRQ11478.1 hypothetical protein C1Y63_05600 [Corynebacterium sp. 13CS0277]
MATSTAADTGPAAGDFWETVDYAAINTGFDPYDPHLDLFNPCADELLPVYEALGLGQARAYDHVIEGKPHLVMWNCLMKDPERFLSDYEIAVEPINPTLIETRSDAFREDAPESIVPGAYFTHNYVMHTEKSGQNCQINIDTARGRLAVSHGTTYQVDELALHCELAQQLLDSVMKDEQFLRALYGDDLPLKSAEPATRRVSQGGVSRGE